jgi:uncharacterized membrane protein YhaH (DUF805 family)
MCYFALGIAFKVLAGVADLVFECLTAEVAVASPIAFLPMPLCALLAYSTLIYLNAAICVGRLHDMDMSGWHYVWLLPTCCVFFSTNWPAGCFPLPAGWRCLAVILYITGVIVSAAFNFVLLLRRGTPGRNRFGERTRTFGDLFRRSTP